MKLIQSLITSFAITLARELAEHLKTFRLVNVTLNVTTPSSGSLTIGGPSRSPEDTVSLTESELKNVKKTHKITEPFKKQDKKSPAFYLGSRGRLFVKTGTEFSLGRTPFATMGPVDNPSSGLLAGQDYKVYACSDGYLHASAYDEKAPENSMAVGGFHVDLGGKILKNSIWDLKFRPKCADPRGMVLVDGKFWVDVYLMSREGTSRAGVEIADGNRFLPNGHKDLNFATATAIAEKQGKQLLSREEFAVAAAGVTEGLATKEKQTLSARFKGLTSKWGLEQATGTLWVWSREKDSDGWPYVLGGSWGNSGNAGPRRVDCSNPRWSTGGVGVRARSDHQIS